MNSVIYIDAETKHDPPGCHVVIGDRGCVVDLSNLPGPLIDPHVVRIYWGPIGKDGTMEGRVIRRISNNASTELAAVPFTQSSWLDAYVAAHKAKWEANHTEKT